MQGKYFEKQTLVNKVFNVKKFEVKVPEKQANSMQMSCILEDATKSISKLLKFEHQIRNHFKTKLGLTNCFFE